MYNKIEVFKSHINIVEIMYIAIYIVIELLSTPTVEFGAEI